MNLLESSTKNLAGFTVFINCLQYGWVGRADFFLSYPCYSVTIHRATFNAGHEAPMKPWKTLSRHTILDRGKFLSVENHIIELPDGRIIDDWSWIVTPDFVLVVALTPDDKFLCFRQTKYAVDGVTLAPVGGYIEPEEDPLLAARRELLEETGHEAEEWIFLGRYPVMANRGGGAGYLYLARGARRVAQPHSDDLEQQELLFLDFDEVEAAIAEAGFNVITWTACVALALLHIKAEDKIGS
jgi:ADP-ribose pyrophosphatase